MSSYSQTEPGPSTPDPAAAPTVLLVEDDTVLRGSLAFDLKRKGFRILQAENAHQAWDLMVSETIHLVVTDIRMPGPSGVALLNQIRAEDPKLPPVILITGQTELNLRDAADWGAQAVFCKPFNRKRFLEACQAAVAQCCQ